MRIFENKDCIEGMKEYPDKYFDLAIVDPPYGKRPIRNTGTMGVSIVKFGSGTDKWDMRPPKEYFEGLFRVSKDQIIFGMNNFIDFLSPTNSVIVWDKLNSFCVMADCELAWTSFNTSINKFTYRWAGMLQQNMKDKEVKIHPTQKPIALYKWILKNYAKPGDLILDTHVGSASSLIACIELGFDYVGYELDPDYYKAATERIARFEAQTDLFRKPAGKDGAQMLQAALFQE